VSAAVPAGRWSRLGRFRAREERSAFLAGVLDGVELGPGPAVAGWLAGLDTSTALTIASWIARSGRRAGR